MTLSEHPSPKSSRKGRFKHQLISNSDIDNCLSNFDPLFQPYLDLYQKKQLSAAELAASYILIFNFIRRPKDALGGILRESPLMAPSSVSGIKTLDWAQKLTDQRLAQKVLSKKGPQQFIDFFYSHSHRSLPFSVNRAIKRWHEGSYHLHLYFNIPDPLEVLQLQVKAQRCVTMLLNFETQNKYNGGRDPLAFLVHDLIHADHFFSSPELVTGQTRFLQLVHLNILHGDFSSLNDDPVFKAEFEYLISDMNSHPAHLIMTFISIIERAVERKLVQSASCKDPQTFILDLFFRWNCPVQVFEALSRLTQKHGSIDKNQDLSLLSIYFNKI